MCEKCGYPDDDGVMLLCDICSRGWHTYCLQPPLVKPPAGDWICPHCIAAGIQVVPPELKEKRKGTEERTNLADKLFATKTTRVTVQNRLSSLTSKVTTSYPSRNGSLSVLAWL